MAIQIPVFDTVIVPITDEQQWLAWPSVQRNSVTRFEFAFFLSGAAEGFHEFAVFVELKHVIGAVTVSDEDRTIRSDCQRAGTKSARVLVDSCFLWKPNRPLLIAVEFEFNDLVIGGTRGVNVFRAVLLA